MLKTDCCSFLASDMDFDKVRGVIDKNAISIKCNADDVAYRLDEFKDRLTDFLELPHVDDVKWNRKRDKFLNAVCHTE